MTHPVAPVVVGETCFNHADQLRFATLSGDVNPMHVDPVAARRLLAGRQVVHGMHALLSALEAWPGTQGDLPTRIAADFAHPICVGDAVVFESESGESGSTTLRTKVRGLACSHIEVGGVAAGPPLPAWTPDLPTPRLAQPLAPLQALPASWVGQRHRLALPAADFSVDFPRTSAWLGERRVAAIALMSCYVGMVCPGLDSIFSSLKLAPGAINDGVQDLCFEVRRFDPRFPLFVIAFSGCLVGEIKAFSRARPQAQPEMSDLLGLVDAAQFKGRQAWVIGGSRGLGELAAKLAAAGGADVTLTYAAGAEDAQRVAADIRSAGRGSVRIQQLDLMVDDLAHGLALTGVPDAVFYFATPRIFKKKALAFDAKVLAEFLTFYVERLHRLCLLLRSLDGEQAIRVFNPSTMFLGARPKGMTEYAMAKAAAEIMIEDFNRGARRVSVLSQRLPKLATDQTSSATGERLESSLAVMLPIVRQMLAPASD